MHCMGRMSQFCPSRPHHPGADPEIEEGGAYINIEWGLVRHVPHAVVRACIPI